MSLRSTFNSASVRGWEQPLPNGIIRGPTGVGFGNKIALQCDLYAIPRIYRIFIGTTVPDSGRKRIYVHNRSYLNSWRYENEIVPTPAAGGSTQWGTDFVINAAWNTGSILVNDPGAYGAAPSTVNNLIYKYTQADWNTRGSSWVQAGPLVISGSGAVLGRNNMFGFAVGTNHTWVAGDGNPAAVSQYQMINGRDMIIDGQTVPATYVPSTICSYIDGSFFASIDSAGSNVVNVINSNGTSFYNITIPSTSPIADIRMTPYTDSNNPVIVIAVPAHNGNTGVVYIYKKTTLMQTITSPAPFAGERFGQSIDVGALTGDDENLLVVGTGQNQTTTGGKIYMYTGPLDTLPLVYDGSWSNPITTTVGTATQYFGKAVSAYSAGIINETNIAAAVSDPFNSVVYCLRRINGVWTVAHG